MKKILFFLMLCSVSPFSWAEHTSKTNHEDLSEEFQILSLEDTPSPENTKHSEKNQDSDKDTMSENSDALSEKDIEHFENNLKIFKDTVGIVKTEKWYHPKHITATLERVIEKELTHCSAEKFDAKTCTVRAEKKIMPFLQHMKKECAKEGAHVKACTDTVDSRIIQVEEGREPLKGYLTNWELIQKKHSTPDLKLKRVNEAPKSWWQSIKNKVSNTIWRS